MTKKLEDILNLPNVKEAFKQVDEKEIKRESKELIQLINSELKETLQSTHKKLGNLFDNQKLEEE